MAEAVAEITEQSTADEVQEYAEQVAKDVEAERAGEEKPDAQIVSEHANNEDQTPKTPVAKSDETEEAGESKSWLDDDAKAEAAAYGIEESELADFASREELDRALRLFDKSALEAGRKALVEGEKEVDTKRNEKGQFVKQPEKTDPRRYEISPKFKEVYDEEMVGELTRLRDHYESRLDAYESRFAAMDERFAQASAAAEAAAEEKHFDSLVDALGHSDLFGKTDAEDAKQLQRRKDLHVAVKAQMLGLAQLGRPTELGESLVSRVARMVFAEDLSKKDLKNRTRKISRQSDGRQGGGATRPQDPREDPRAEADRLYKELAGT